MEKRDAIYYFKTFDGIKSHYLKYISKEKFQAVIAKVNSTFKKRKNSSKEENLLDFLAAIDNAINKK